jgi:hypothetical protein
LKNSILYNLIPPLPKGEDARRAGEGENFELFPHPASGHLPPKGEGEIIVLLKSENKKRPF